MCTLQISVEQEELSRFLKIHDANNKEECVVVLKDVDDVLETMRIGEESPIDVEIQHIEIFYELEGLPTVKILKLYTTLSSTSTINRFAPMFERKLNRCMMNCDEHLRCFSESLTN